MKHRRLTISILLGLTILCVPILQAESQIPVKGIKKLSLAGDVRFGYFGQIGEQRDGSDLNIHELRLRSRTGLKYVLNDQFYVQARYALRMNSRNIALSPGLHTSAPGKNGLSMGEGAFDEAFMEYTPANWVLVRAGRFQTSYTVNGVISNAIIRNDSPNTDISWTDGFLLNIKPLRFWTASMVMQLHLANPPTNVFRYPLQIDSEITPYTAFFSVERSFPDKIIDFITVDATFSPDALIETAEGNRKNYIAASVKSRLSRDLDMLRKLLWGGEVAYSFNRPEKDMTGFLNINGEKAGGLGFQTNVSIINLFKDHHLGFIAAVLEPSLLTSADYWNNIMLFEVRHQYAANHRLSFETRLRYRGDHKKPDSAINRRWQLYPYARLTYRFR